MKTHSFQNNLHITKTNELTLANDYLGKLNADQLYAYETILNSMCLQSGQMFFLNGPAGTGKTFMYQTLCHHICTDSQIILCVASSGITALLLPGGHTAHSMFLIPVDGLSEDSLCNINKNSKQAIMLRCVDLIIWDEAAMQHQWVLMFFYFIFVSN